MSREERRRKARRSMEELAKQSPRPYMEVVCLLVHFAQHEGMGDALVLLDDLPTPLCHAGIKLLLLPTPQSPGRAMT